jgi:uncharacterized membrane protein YtjA (UPF0391 family)
MLGVGANCHPAYPFCIRGCRQRKKAERKMMKTAVLFLVLAFIAGVFGVSGASASAGGVAKALCLVFLILFGVMVFLRLYRGRRPSL